MQHPERVSHLVTMGPLVRRRAFLVGPNGPTERLKITNVGHREPSPTGTERMVEIMVFDRERFAAPELVEERSETAPRHPEHLADVLAGTPNAPIPIWLDPTDLGARRRVQPVGHRFRDPPLLSKEGHTWL